MKKILEARQFSELGRNNQTCMFAHVVDVTVMCMFCLLQALTGTIGIGYIIVLLLLGYIPIAIERVAWKKDQEHTVIKHAVAVGYAIFYTFTVFTAQNLLVVYFAIPMILVISVYNDTRYSLMVNSGVVIESFIMVIIGSQNGKFGYISADHAILQIVIFVLVAIYSYMTSRTLNDNAVQKMNHLSEAQKETEHLLAHISALSEKTGDGIHNINGDLVHLNEVAESNRTAMENVSKGALETANAVQEQLTQTESIQKQVETANDAAIRIRENMQQTLAVLEDGNREVQLLVTKVKTSVQNGADVADKLSTLDKYIEEMQSIVEIISEIASQTALLSLNASIEAARAGEAGRGFAVVASEISKMATQTNDATTHITGLIDNVSSSINAVVEVIYQMISSINEEKQSTETAAKSFEQIQENTYSVRDNIESLAENIAGLKQSNEAIVQAVQTISAISEELSAHANETLTAEEESTEVVSGISDKMAELVELTKQS